ncbi:MAG: site-specific integrase [Solirubrobacterales bacterium]|nr:site-specific integrase [Solirubrobacterales bacterium]
MQKTRHPGIYKRGSRYAVTYRVNGRQRWESTKTLKEALQIKRRRESDLDSGEFFEASRETFADYAAEWIERYQGNGRRGFTEPTRDDYRRDLRRYAFPKIGDRPLATITPRHIANWIGWLCDEREQGRNLADATVGRIVAPVRSCLSTARREGLIRQNPADGAVLPDRPKIDEEEHSKALTREELAAFLRIVRPEWQLMFRFLAATGVRWSELIALRWSDLQLDGGEPHVRIRRAIVRGKAKPPKSRHGRRDVPLSLALADRLRAERGPDDALVFSAENGEPLRQENVRRRVLAPAAEEADVSWIGFHTFRHTRGSLLFAAGKNPKQVQGWLGHHSPAFTLNTYAHLLDEGLGEALDLDAELAAGCEQTANERSRIGPDSAELDSEEYAELLGFPDLA